MPAPADRVTGHPEQREDQADHDCNDADRPENRYSADEPDNEENYAKNDQGRLLACGGPRPGRGQKKCPDVSSSNCLGCVAACGIGPARTACDRRASAFSRPSCGRARPGRARRAEAEAGMRRHDRLAEQPGEGEDPRMCRGRLLSRCAGSLAFADTASAAGGRAGAATTAHQSSLAVLSATRSNASSAEESIVTGEGMPKRRAREHPRRPSGGVTAPRGWPGHSAGWLPRTCGQILPQGPPGWLRE